MSSPNTGPKTNVLQKLKFNGPESEYCAELVGDHVSVQCGTGIHNHGSSKVKLINRIDYNWEFRYYHGNLITMHINGKIYAYAMKCKEGGMVRVGNQDTNQRALIKNFRDDVKDIAFAFSRKEIILGCVDAHGNVLVFEINDEPQAINYTILLHLFHPDNFGSRPISNYRIIWCPYIPSYEDEDSGDDPEKMFVVLNGQKAEIINVAMMNAKHGSGPSFADESYEGYTEINHSCELVDASFSADGTAIAIACSDGYVKFFQLYLVNNEKQNCLHEWRPHEGKPLSSIIFIDNVLEYSSECWKFAITGANNNSEIKLWSCESWTCLQTIYFNLDSTSIIPELYLNIALDYSGQFLVVSDINNRFLYVLQLKRNDKEQFVHVTHIAKFLLPSSFLSFHILEAASRKVPCSFNNSTEDLYNEDRDFDEDEDVTTVFLKMLIIQPKKFQECNITFQPESLVFSKGNVSEICDKKEEVEKLPKLDDLQSSVTLLIQQQTNKSQMNLMTPDVFNADNRPSSVRSSHNEQSETVEDTISDYLIDFQRPQKENFASGGSSPSREVQEILSLNNSYSNQDCFDKLQEEEAAKSDYEPKPEKLIFNESSNKDIIWPKVPVIEDNNIVKEESLLQDLSLDQASLQSRMNSLEKLIREQNSLMQKLDQDIKALSLIRCSKDDFIKELDIAMSKQHLQIAKMLENLMNMQKVKDREMHDHIVNSIGQIFTKTLSEKLQVIVSYEMKNVIHTLTETYRHQVESMYSQKIASTDILLKEHISKALNSKVLADSLSMSVVKVVEPSLEKCYRDIIASSLIPSWERICGQMFQQINDTFTKGTKEYTASVESYMDKQRGVQERGKDLITKMQDLSEKMNINVDKMTISVSSEVHKICTAVFKNIQDRLTMNIKEIVSEQIKQGFKNHASMLEAIRSRAVTPSPHVDTQVTISHIQQYLARGSYDEAFQLALSAENLACVIYVCESVDINAIFDEDCPLQQSCLLALIQQLSMDLQKNTELKLSFIRAAFLALSPDFSATKQFIPKVLKDLLKQLQLFMSGNPPLKHMTDAKLLKMAVENMIGK